MKVAVVCANGKAGSLIVKEAVERGLDVTAIAKEENRSVATQFVEKDLFDLTSEDLKGFDAVVDAFGAWTAETVDGIYKAVDHLCKILKGTETRLLVVGGAGSLYLDKAHTICLSDGPDFPDVFKPVARVHGIALDHLRKIKDVRWTYISPAADFRADGERTGGYLLGGEELMTNAKGESTISYADYAIAMVDELVDGNHIGQRISVVSK